MLKGKVAFVTGASRGIGAMIAEKLAENGAGVALIYNGNADKAEKLKEKLIENYGVTAKAYKCNIAKHDEVKKTVDEVLADFGAVDILVNNAGITKDGLILSMEEDEFDSVVDVNLKGCFNTVKALSRNFIRKKYGKIINISSVSGLFGLAGQTNYSASKAGIIGFTKALAKELGGKNINCNSVAPGFIMTDMTRNLEETDFINNIPLKRPGKPEDVANLVVFLASPLSDYITGEVIRVDGGIAM